MVGSISKIPDSIKRQIYIQETSRIMDISEQILLNTLAQLVQKDITEAGKKLKQEYKGLEAVKDETETVQPKVDRLYMLERKIIEILLIHGNINLDFVDYFLKKNEEDELIEEKAIVNCTVSERIFLSLQEDETEFTNELFKNIYNQLIDYYNQNKEKINYDDFLTNLNEDYISEITSITMEYERDSLSNWEGQNIFVSLRESEPKIIQDVTETILTLRAMLVKLIINELITQVDSEADNSEVLQMINDYNMLLHNFSEKLGRVIIS